MKGTPDRSWKYVTGSTAGSTEQSQIESFDYLTKGIPTKKMREIAADRNE